jgi:DNA-binding CsgD family transcriptional regulator
MDPTSTIEADPADYLLHAARGYVSAALAYLAAACGERNLTEVVARERKRLGLTKREAEVLPLVAHGFTNREIAAELVISVRTAEHHVEHILRKLGARDRREAAAIVRRLASRLGEERLEGAPVDERLHGGVVGPLLESLGRVENVRQQLHVAHRVQEDAVTAEHPVHGKLDLVSVGERLVPRVRSLRPPVPRRQRDALDRLHRHPALRAGRGKRLELVEGSTPIATAV